MDWVVRIDTECRRWYNSLTELEKASVIAGAELLMEHGPRLGRPHVDTVEGSRYPNMKELRVQHAGKPIRILFAFDPNREAILLVGGKKAGDDRWYETHIPIADELFARHLARIRKKGNK